MASANKKMRAGTQSLADEHLNRFQGRQINDHPLNAMVSSWKKLQRASSIPGIGSYRTFLAEMSLRIISRFSPQRSHTKSFYTISRPFRPISFEA
jgi:hypothetical protein